MNRTQFLTSIYNHTILNCTKSIYITSDDKELRVDASNVI
ncbi:hypothetical protein SPI02_21460 [Staphylococcus piscifermentans]|uniref:Uncharacterized protein n=1 Tax=Staphylococcus piscifermentans TaxID=70258 RepID=A0A512QQ54_9STAP|nr:hypothetical protein SPI02_21460 [Staphylococcus piscifermentans]